MSDPFSPEPNSTNGSNAAPSDHNGHLGQSDKLPQDSLSQSSHLERGSGKNRQDIRKTFYMLLAVGLILGAVTAGGVVWLMNRLDLVGVPEQPE